SLIFTAPAPTAIYPLSLHDALPILQGPFGGRHARPARVDLGCGPERASQPLEDRLADVVGVPAVVEQDVEVHPPLRCHGLPEVGDRKSTRLNSSHDQISYAVFCLKK